MTHLAERVHELHPGPMKGLDIAGARIVTGGSDGTVRLLAINGEHMAAASVHTDVVNDVALGPDATVASGSRDRKVRLFYPDVGRSYTIGEHDHWVMAVAWSPDGSHVASGSEDGTVGIWAPEGASVTRVSLGRPVNGVDWRGDVIAAVTGDGVLRFLDSSGAVLREIAGATQILWDVALAPDGARAAWVGRDRLLRITRVDDGDTLEIPAHDDQIWGVTWDATGERIATTAADGTCAIWSPAGEALERIEVGPWLRRPRFRGVELYLATEDGNLSIYSSDGLPATAPDPITIPEPPDSCAHWDPQVEDAGSRPRCAVCGSVEEARLCVTCGYVGCCESQLAHATKHWIETGHPNTVPVPTREFGWRWCYADDMYVKR
jgi:hypothetical protein